MRTDSKVWEFTSSGAGAWYDMRGISRSVTFYIETNGTSTATIRIDEAGSTSSTSHARVLSAAASLSTGESTIATVSRPVSAVRPYVQSMSTGGVRVELVGEGSW